MTIRPRWMCLADARSCHLLCAEINEGGRWHLDELDVLRNEHEDDKQHTGPHELARLVERGAPSHAEQGHQKEEERRRFAKDAAGWIARKLKKHEIPNLHLFAASSMIGEIRRQAGADIWRHATEHEADLNSIPRGELVKHPAVRPVLAMP